ncbi:hypothetical protein ACTQ6A_12490 [Lachnospiraceae bacterium LCP25S3_G4]
MYKYLSTTTKRIFLCGNSVKVLEVSDELSFLHLDYVMLGENYIEQVKQIDFCNSDSIIICHNKYEEYLRYLKELLIVNRNLKEICLSQFHFYQTIAEYLIIDDFNFPYIEQNQKYACIT